MAGKDKDIAGVIAPPPLIYGIPLALGLWIHATIGGMDVPETILPWLPRALTGGALAAAGAVIIVLALLRFGQAKTPPEPWEETTALVTGGIYRRTRNPMYLGMALIFFGITLIAACLLLLALFVLAVVVIDRGVIRREESYMERKFGDDYRAYKAATKRWI
ncbi:methyltransferase family protein [Sphingomicrobium lutaoense]|uniref:Protein-S-isoprenylcysteine O-methyltransferase Ste14 n=1 Tax=Sphingomicrobium lutaoense TaxID=515949 RepID=A0A839Z123_9SPHN|nr:isoprenylcysteine carboxylmethyltransferase family protein [Sphingomicrobium lutaoense]MBB3764380.1 protein-S-isoprenylcysteine O-methyltransferase Ste14 [Sphingomicrobium lutaoense]